MLSQRFGLIAGAAASAVLVAWLAFADGPAKVMRADVDPALRSARAAQANLAEGKRLYRAGEYRAALESLLRATDGAAELTNIQREELENYLHRSRTAASRRGDSLSGVFAHDDTSLVRGQSEDSTAAKAQTLLRAAREAMSAGDFETAEAKIAEAEKLEVVYGVFDDRPGLVKQDLAHMQQSAGGTKTPPQTAKSKAQPKPNAQGRAAQLVMEARAALEAGDTETALKKADEAEQIGAKFSAFEDRPEMIRADAASMSGSTSASKETSSKGSQNPFSAGESAASQGEIASPMTAAAETPSAQSESNANPFGGQAEPKKTGSQKPDSSGSSEKPQSKPTVTTAEAAQAPSGAGAGELYDFGVERLRAGDTQGAYAAFVQAHETGEKLDAYRQEQLQNYLRELAPSKQGVQKAAATGGPSMGPSDATPLGAEDALDAATQAEKVKYDELRTEVLNAIFRAERLRESNPDEALAILDRTHQAIGSSELAERHQSRLRRQLERSKESIESYAKQMAPKIELEQKNQNVKESIQRDLESEAQQEKEMKRLVDKYNKLMDQKSFAEAEQVAKQAKALDPENPITVTMVYKAKMAFQIARNEEVKEGKAKYFTNALHEVDKSVAEAIAGDIKYAENWDDLSEARLEKYGANGLVETERDKQIRESLDRPISLHFDNVPLSQVMADVSDKTGFNVVIDQAALDAESITSDTPMTIDVDGIMVKSALNLMLEPLGMGYVVKNEVLNITSAAKMQGELETRPYPVADLVIPIPNFAPGSDGAGFFQGVGKQNGGLGQQGMAGAPQMSIPSMGGPQGQAFGQVVDPANPIGGGGIPRATTRGGARGMEFNALVDLISTTIAPDSWEITGGQGVLTPSEQTLSLVVRQTQQVHEEIEDLLTQLRNLQDIQVTVEVRFINVSDDFAEFIGVDFDFNLQDSLGGPVGPGFGEELNPGEPPTGGDGDGGTGQGNTQGGEFFETGNPDRDLRDYDSYRKGTVVGVPTPGTISGDLDIPFRQGSFDFAQNLQGLSPDAGASIGFAVLSDIEAFFFIQAVQQDSRSNVLSAPKITLFNGQTATISDQIRRPFVTSITPVVGIQSVGFQPEITIIPDGVSLAVQAVVSADRRYVRLTLFPQFTTILDIETFTFSSGANVGGLGGLGGGGIFGGQGGGLGGGIGGQGGGLGGGIGGGGQGAQISAGGIGGGRIARDALLAALPAQQNGGQNGGQDGGQNGGQDGGQDGGQQGQAGQSGQQGTQGQGQTLQQPIISNTSISTTVSVPDGGTILMGGVKRLTERRRMAGVPILNKLPYVNRLFKNSGVERQTSSLMMMVTPRIIIADEEEELLASPLAQ